MAFISLQLLLDPELYKRALDKASHENKSLDQVVIGWLEDWANDGQPTGPISPTTPPPPASEPMPREPGSVPQMYTVKTGDSLWTIARRFYGDGNKYVHIVQANNLNETRRIYAGMRLVIPPAEPETKPPIAVPSAPTPKEPGGASAPDLTIPSRPPVAPPNSIPSSSRPQPLPPSTPEPTEPTPTPIPSEPPPAPASPVPRAGVAPKPGYPIVPDSLQGVEKVFGKFTYKDLTGNPPGRIQIDAKWLAANIVTTQIPVLGTVQCHRLLVPVFVNVFKDLQAQGLAQGLKYWGCFVPRHKGWDASQDLSVHAWGIALDLNADTNAAGTEGNLDPRVIRIFAEHGFYWGGNFGDPMHFQYTISY